jgi:antibiotic biosynthesis monooxygenase (ABM) superfamily enzyme
MAGQSPDPARPVEGPAEPAQPILEVRGVRASSVIVQRFPAEGADLFMHWMRGITAAAAIFPGYVTTEVYPPAAGEEQWVVILHFDEPEYLQSWLDSPARAEWVAKLPREIRDFRIRTMPSGFGAWFAGLTEGGARIAHWKMFLAVLLALYPAVMLLILVLSPQTARFGTAVQTLIGNIVSVALLEWLLMPVTTRGLARWLRAAGPDGRAVSLAGLALIVVALGAMTLVFRLATG